MRRELRALIVSGAFVVATAFLAWGADPTTIPTTAGFTEFSDAQCYSHHAQEGFRSMDIFPEEIASVEKGKLFVFHITVTNPWLHEILEIDGFVNVSKAPGFRFLGEKEPFEQQWVGTLGGVAPQDAFSEAFAVDANATEIYAWLEGEPGAVSGNDFDLAIAPPGAGVVYRAPADTSEQGVNGERAVWSERVRVPYADVANGGEGQWSVAVTFQNTADRVPFDTAPGPDAAFTVGVGVYYNLSRSAELRVAGPGVLKPSQSHTFAFEVVAAEAAGRAELIFGATGDAHHKHTDPNAEDHGNHTKFSSVKFDVSTQTVIGSARVVTIGPSADPLMKAWAQVLGFAASFLLVPSLVLGGTFGPGTVNGLNKLLGARRRILWHNAASFLLLAIALLHTILFLSENFWSWSKGVVWGSLSLACMVGLGFNGAMQRRFVARWGFARWRFTHFALGILMCVFVLVHLMADGTHFQPVLKRMGLV